MSWSHYLLAIILQGGHDGLIVWHNHLLLNATFRHQLGAHISTDIRQQNVPHTKIDYTISSTLNMANRSLIAEKASTNLHAGRAY